MRGTVFWRIFTEAQSRRTVFATCVNRRGDICNKQSPDTIRSIRREKENLVPDSDVHKVSAGMELDFNSFGQWKREKANRNRLSCLDLTGQDVTHVELWFGLALGDVCERGVIERH